ncbi:MAG: 6,7-dimethyl-8-ribityllumazine synthase [Rhodobacteraceae bacterium]|nr:6,7-dimethyl-8-ribityllumazine synthase [Paracoccaceae bacterium]
MAGTESHYTLPPAEFDGKKPHLLIVISPYYKDIAGNLLAGAKAAIVASGATCDVVEVPGALEVPTAIRLAEAAGSFDGYVALGCVIRGETTHYETVCNDSSRGLTLLGLDGFCIGNGILTVENRKQAEVRADAEGQNKGGGAADAALHLIAISRKFVNTTKGIGFKPASEHIVVAGDDKGPKTA